MQDVSGHSSTFNLPCIFLCECVAITNRWLNCLPAVFIVTISITVGGILLENDLSESEAYLGIGE